jgi:L-iditol 2-dehydrogenase
MITGTDGDEKLRLPAAHKMGIDHIVNIQKEDVQQLIQDLTGGAGADVVVEASGAAASIRQAFDLVKIDGRICGLGLSGRDEIGIPWDAAIVKAVRLICSMSSNWTSWERALSLMSSGKVNVDPVITATCELTQWQQAFDQLQNLEAIKILIKP